MHGQGVDQKCRKRNVKIMHIPLWQQPSMKRYEISVIDTVYRLLLEGKITKSLYELPYIVVNDSLVFCYAPKQF